MELGNFFVRRGFENANSSSSLAPLPQTSLVELFSFMFPSQGSGLACYGGSVMPPWHSQRADELLHLALSCDCLSLCLFDPRLFVHDYKQGLVQYCSPALVAALFSLGTLCEGTATDELFCPIGTNHASRYSICLLGEALALLRKQSQLNDLPDIQALGVLALTQTMHGDIENAQRLAENYSTSITNLYLHPLSPPAESRQSMRARASTFCAAISLSR